jgi:hypothetical protein
MAHILIRNQLRYPVRLVTERGVLSPQSAVSRIESDGQTEVEVEDTGEMDYAIVADANQQPGRAEVILQWFPHHDALSYRAHARSLRFTARVYQQADPVVYELKHRSPGWYLLRVAGALAIVTLLLMGPLLALASRTPNRAGISLAPSPTTTASPALTSPTATSTSPTATSTTPDPTVAPVAPVVTAIPTVHVPPPPAPHGNLVVSPATVDLGNYCGDSFSTALTVANTGTGSLTWSVALGSSAMRSGFSALEYEQSLKPAAPDSGYAFTFAPNAGQLGPGATISVGVTGNKVASSYAFTWHDGANGAAQTQHVSFTCSVRPPLPHGALVVQIGNNSPGGSVSVVCPTSIPIVLTNTGGGPVTWFSPGFGPAGEVTLAPGAAYSVTVSIAGDFTTDVVWTDVNYGQTYTIPIYIQCRAPNPP